MLVVISSTNKNVKPILLTIKVPFDEELDVVKRELLVFLRSQVSEGKLEDLDKIEVYARNRKVKYKFNIFKYNMNKEFELLESK